MFANINYINVDRQRVVDTSPPTPNSPDVDVVQETQPKVGGSSSQPKKGKRQHKRKPVEQPRTRQPAVAWTPEEEMNLAKAWLDVTEDPKEGIYTYIYIF